VFDAPAGDAAPAPRGGPPAAAPRADPAVERDAMLARLRQLPVSVVAAVVLGVASLGLAALLATGAVAGGITVDGAAGIGSPIGSAAVTSTGVLVVDVSGAVLRPGVYRLPPGSRVGDAIAAAGGYSPRVAAERASSELNLAAPLHDGEQIDVPSRDEPTGTQASGIGGVGGSHGGSALVDLNRASAEELDALPGIGPVTAAKIIAARTDSPFTSVDQLLDRKLVGQKVFDQIKSLVTIGR
jgi:competence protein ComEA